MTFGTANRSDEVIVHHPDCTGTSCEWRREFVTFTYRTEPTIDSVTIPAYASYTLGETLTIAAPREWHDRIIALAAFTCYGPTFNRRVLDTLVDLDRQVRGEYTALAYDSLLAAERFAGITPKGA